MQGAFLNGVDPMNLELKEGQLTGNEALDDLVSARPMSILGVPLIGGGVATLMFPLPSLPSPASLLLGIALIGSAILIGLWAIRTMADGGASPDAIRPPSALITEGPFGFSRNPIYLGFVFIYAGTGMVIGSLWILLLTPLVVLGLTQAIIVHDERLLESRFGNDYRAYRARVRRWI